MYALVQFWKEGRRQGGRVARSAQEGPTMAGGSKIIVIPKYNSKAAPPGQPGILADVKKCG